MFKVDIFNAEDNVAEKYSVVGYKVFNVKDGYGTLTLILSNNSEVVVDLDKDLAVFIYDMNGVEQSKVLSYGQN